MKFTGIYIYVDGCDLDEFGDLMVLELQKWVSSNNINAKVINDKFEKTPDMEADDYPDWNLGINLDDTKKLNHEISIIIPFLNEVALKYKRDFVLGYYDKETNITEDIEYFGYKSKKEAVDIVNSISEFLGI